MNSEKFKLLWLPLCCFLLINLCNAQPCQCLSKNAKYHADEFCKVTGFISDVICISNVKGNMVYLNVGNKFQDKDLSVIIHEKYLKNFSKSLDLLYKSKMVSIYGVIKIIKGKPLIFIKKESDIEIN